MEKKRLFGPDLVRCVACIFVLGVHFYLYTGFYSRPYQGTAMMISVPLRMALMSCVPLFMILSGYLCVHKKWSRGYYGGLGTVITNYVFCGLICIAFMYFNAGIPVTAWTTVKRLLDFTAVPYGWYVEMYIGLFLLVPLINAGWNALPEGGKKAVFISLLILGILPNITNYHFVILPDYWGAVYPLAYYVAGAWLKENKPKIKGIWLVLGWVLFSLVSCIWQYDLFAESKFTFSVTNYFYSPFVFASSFCLFAALIRVEGEHIPKAVKWCVRNIAKLSFCIYMLSYIGDSIIYPRLSAAVPAFEKIILFHIPCVAVNLVFSAILALIADYISKAIIKLIRTIWRKSVPSRGN